jgi:hypothetical protein
MKAVSGEECPISNKEYPMTKKRERGRRMEDRKANHSLFFAHLDIGYSLLAIGC